MSAPLLSPRLTRFVSRSVQHRGAEYFLAHRLKIVDGTELDVRATVRGTHPDPYHVSIARESDDFLVRTLQKEDLELLLS